LASTKSGSAADADGSGEKERSSAREEEKKREAEMRREESRTEARRGAAQRRWLWWVADAGPGDGGLDSIIAGRAAFGDRDRSPAAVVRGLNVGDDGWCWRVVEGCGGGEATALQGRLASHETGRGEAQIFQENNQLVAQPDGFGQCAPRDGRTQCGVRCWVSNSVRVVVIDADLPRTFFSFQIDPQEVKSTRLGLLWFQDRWLGLLLHRIVGRPAEV
jgi:hypothetical protein